MTQTTKRKKVYFNRSQIEIIYAKQKIRTVIAGRGFGKSTLIAWIIYMLVKHLPRGKFFLSSTNLEQVLNSTLPPVKEKWLEFGLIEGIHYVIGKAPPAWFKSAYSEPEDYTNVISFFNGARVVILSLAKPKGKRGGSYDAGIVDEAAFVKRKTFWNVLKAQIRGNLYRFNSIWHHSLFILSSPPTPDNLDGFWVYDFEKLAQKHPSKYFFKQASARDNQDILGVDFFTENKRSMPHEEYEVEIEGKRITQRPGGFYHSFSRQKHTYKPTMDWQRNMSDVRPNELLEASFDFSGKFNCCTVWQEYDNIEHLLCGLHASHTEGKLRKVVDMFIQKFKYHRFKYVRLYGEPRGRDKQINEEDDIYEQIQKQLEQAGWFVEIRVVKGYKTQNQSARYLLCDDILTECNPALPKFRINEVEAADVIIAIEGAGIMPDFSKDKSKEKDPNYPQQHATHYTDTKDYYLWTKHHWKRDNPANNRPGEAWTQ